MSDAVHELPERGVVRTTTLRGCDRGIELRETGSEPLIPRA
jgi:hypothetical protein